MKRCRDIPAKNQLCSKRRKPAMLTKKQNILQLCPTLTPSFLSISPRRRSQQDPPHLANQLPIPCLEKLLTKPVQTAITQYTVGDTSSLTHIVGILAGAQPPSFLRKFQRSIDVSMYWVYQTNKPEPEPKT